MDAAQATTRDRKYRLTKLALQGPACFARTLALTAAMKTQRRACSGTFLANEYHAEDLSGKYTHRSPTVTMRC